MATKIRPEISKKDKYYVEKERYYELLHFVKQYPIWTKALASLTSMAESPIRMDAFARAKGCPADPVAKCAEAREAYKKKIDIVDRAIMETDPEIGSMIFIGVTEGYSYEVIKARYNIPCGRNTYYELYRKFFYVLNKLRD